MRGCFLGVRLLLEARQEDRPRERQRGDSYSWAWCGTSWIWSCGSWQVNVETVIGEAIGLLGSVEGRFGFNDCFQLVLLVLGDKLGAKRKVEFAAKEQKQCFRAIWANSGVRKEDETRGALSCSHRIIVSEGGAAGFCMTFL